MDSTRERTRRLVEADKRHLWHPFTPMQEWNAGQPLVIERGEGNYLVDTDGNRYLDGVASLWVNVHGHAHPYLNRAIREQLERVAHSTLLGLANAPAVELAERLAAVAPAGLGRVFYSDSGSTAVEIALKQAFQYCQLVGETQRTKFVHLAEAYHGDTLGAVSVGGIDIFHQIFGPLLVDSFSFPTPHPYRHPQARTPEEASTLSLQALDRLLQDKAPEVAAVIVEPLVQGAAGILVHPPGFLAGVAALCRQHGVLLIVDEVATGFGRTGTLFACEQEDVTPDFLCLAKGISAGYLPLAATLTTERVYEAFLAPREQAKSFFHGHTYTGNPLACAAALASLDLFEREAVIAGLPPKIAALEAALADLSEHRHVGDVRQRGLMVGVELVADRATADPFPAAQATGHRVCLAARAHGVIVRNLGDVIVLMPPLSIQPDECRTLVAAVASAIEEVVG